LHGFLQAQLQNLPFCITQCVLKFLNAVIHGIKLKALVAQAE
jgi:hypothetical protein